MGASPAVLERRFRRATQVLKTAPPIRHHRPYSGWGEHYFPDYFTVDPSPFHQWFDGQLATLHCRRGTYLDQLAPRGSAKSTRATFVYPLYCICEGLEPYIVLSSDTSSQSEIFLQAISTELESNPRIEADYPHVFGRGNVWRTDRLETRNGLCIEALGTGQKVRGRRWRQDRPSLVIMDDPQNRDHIVSPLKRERSWQWVVQDVMNAGSPTTNVIALGTALHREAIVYRLQKTAKWQSRLWKAVIEWPERMDLWREWQTLLQDWEDDNREAKALAFYEDHRDEMNAGAVVLWPQREPLYDLMLHRASIGSAAFEAEKQNNPVDPEACEWPGDYFDYPDFWYDQLPPEGLRIRVMSLDPSKGKDAKVGDYSAWVMYSLDRNGRRYVEADLGRRPVDVILDAGVDHAKRFRPDVIVLEENAFQDLLGPLLMERLKKAGINTTVCGETSTAAKVVRVRRLTQPLSERRLRFKRRSPGTQLLVDQMRDFPIGDHDDGPDALELAERKALEWLEEGRR